MNNLKTRKLIIAALFAALTCVATMVIHIPIPVTNGYVNLGDCIVLISGFMLGGAYGGITAGLGSALADIILGYVSYAPATFIIKALMAVCASLIYRFPGKGNLRPLIAAFVGEIIMVSGYYLYESFIYGFAGAAPGIISNAAQGVVGIVAAFVLIKIFNNVEGIKKYFK